MRVDMEDTANSLIYQLFQCILDAIHFFVKVIKNENFQTQEKCIEYIIEKRIIYDKLSCRNFGQECKRFCDSADLNCFRCNRSKKCRNLKTNLWTGTIFFRAKVYFAKVCLYYIYG